MNLGIEAMRRKFIDGGGIVVASERQVAADSARWGANRRALKNPTSSGEEDSDSSRMGEHFSLFLQRLRRFGTSLYKSPASATPNSS